MNNLKKIFKVVSFDTTNHSKIKIKATSPILENVNEKAELSMYVYGNNLIELNPVVKWGYYTNPLVEKESIEFNNNLNEIEFSIKEIFSKNRLSDEYLKEISISEISENNEENEVDVMWEWEVNDYGENVLVLFENKLKDYISDVKISINEMIYLDRLDNDIIYKLNDDILESYIIRDPQVGDHCQLTLSLDKEEFILENWLEIKKTII